MNGLNRRRRAITMIEAALVLAIAGVVLGAVWAAASAVVAENKLNQAHQLKELTVQNLRAVYAQANPAILPQPPPANLMQELDVADVFPLEMQANPAANNGVIVHPLSRAIPSVNVSYNNPAPTGFPFTVALAFLAVDGRDCAALLTRDAPAQMAETGLVAIDVGTTNFADFPLAATDAALACGGAAAVDITWTYRVR